MHVVLTIDQRGSRRAMVRASQLARTLNHNHARSMLRRFGVTVGDEIQGVLADADALPDILRSVLAQGTWWIGIGIGDLGVLAQTSRESSGPAFYMARQAVSRAKKTAWGIAVEPAELQFQMLDAAIAVWSTLLSTRTPKGWEAAGLRDRGLLEPAIAKRLRITQQAVNQRLRAAYYAQDVAGAGLIRNLLNAPGLLGD